jgi:prolyl-tRNA synthetase
MRASDLVFQTQREDPHDAEVASHRLLVRGGYIRALASGVFSFLPLGFRVLERISRVIVEEWDRVGGNQVLLPALHPRELWDETGRSVTMDDVLMRVDSKLGELVLGPTHEEAVIAAVAPDLPSYRALPAFVYQIQTKFRDEPRARFGLMRTREFLMADGYTFDADRDGMRSSYQRIYDAYGRIYARLGLAAIPVEADAGSIGGDVNHEFMVASAIGEDRFASCGQCGYRANVEAARRGQGPEVKERKKNCH